VDKKQKKASQKTAKTSEFSTEITCLRWSHDDTLLAAGHQDAYAHIFSVERQDSDVQLVPWESSLDVSNGLVDLRWSKDLMWLITFTKDQDLMVWFINGEERSFEHYLYWLDPDKVEFDGEPLLAGWDVQGLFQTKAGWDGTDLNCLSLTHHKFKKTSPLAQDDCEREGNSPQTGCRLIASGDNKGFIRLHNYPAIKEEAHHMYNGHANQVAKITWDCSEQFLFSAGGADKSLFQWKLVKEPTDYIKLRLDV
jgi:WD40 repeat protein